MNKFYYFSRSKLQLVEIRHYKGKLAALILLTALTSGLLVFGGLTLYYTYIASPNDNAALRRENEFLNDKLFDAVADYEKLKVALDSLMSVNNDLRIAVNLPPLTDEETALGTGGGSFNNLLDFLQTNNKEDLEQALTFIEDVKNRFSFQKQVYEQIAEAYEQNQELFKCIPAIIPSEGVYSEDSFGMRRHPVLKIMRFHYGLDITTGIGTPVRSTGNGTVVFTGTRGGYGRAIEINHGFGYRSFYAHLSRINVEVGQKVSRGDIIGKTGNSGLSSGPHLHYEVRHNGVAVDPALYFFHDFDYIAARDNLSSQN